MYLFNIYVLFIRGSFIFSYEIFARIRTNLNEISHAKTKSVYANQNLIKRLNCFSRQIFYYIALLPRRNLSPCYNEPAIIFGVFFSASRCVWRPIFNFFISVCRFPHTARTLAASRCPAEFSEYVNGLA